MVEDKAQSLRSAARVEHHISLVRLEITAELIETYALHRVVGRVSAEHIAVGRGRHADIRAEQIVVRREAHGSSITLMQRDRSAVGFEDDRYIGRNHLTRTGNLRQQHVVSA